MRVATVESTSLVTVGYDENLKRLPKPGRTCSGASARMPVWMWRNYCQMALTSAGFTHPPPTGGMGGMGWSCASSTTV